MGETVSYADFIFVTMLKWFQRVDQSIYDRAASHDEAFSKLFKACEKWMQRED